MKTPRAKWWTLTNRDGALEVSMGHTGYSLYLAASREAALSLAKYYGPDGPIPTEIELRLVKPEKPVKRKKSS